MALSKLCKECRGISVPLPGLTSCAHKCCDVPPPSHSLGVFCCREYPPCPGRTLHDLSLGHCCPLGRGSMPAAVLQQRAGQRLPAQLPTTRQPGWGGNRSLPSCADPGEQDRVGAEEDGLHVLEGSSHPGAGKHIAKGWAEPHPPHITAESSCTPGCSSCHHPALSSPLHSASSVGPLSCKGLGPDPPQHA